MNMKNVTCISILIVIISTPALADFKSLTDIEASLGPLALLDNHGGVRRSVELDIRFALASAELLHDATRQLDALGNAMQGERLQKYAFNIIGHTDASGNAKVNMQLSKDRAASVSHYLQQEFGIEADRLATIGKGETDLKPNTDRYDPSQRRVEIVARHPDNVGGSDVGGSDVDASDVDASDVDASDVDASDVDASDVDANSAASTPSDETTTDEDGKVQLDW